MKLVTPPLNVGLMAHTLSALQARSTTSSMTGRANVMNDDVLEQLRSQVRAPLAVDNVTEDTRLKAEILLMRSHAHVLEDQPGHFV